jgi:nitrate/nitrite transporter NarK
MSKFSTKTLLTLLVIIIAGELIYSLPFHIPRFFRPVFFEVFELSNTQMGDIFAVYGVVAMLSYFPGGVLADHFPPRKLMFYSLIATAMGGVYLATLPPVEHLYFLFGYWGCTSVLLFWSAMIKQTRSLAGEDNQGSAFGLLDGGRGLVASLAASVAVLILARYIAVDDQSTLAKRQSMQAVILFYAGMTALAACLVWFGLKQESTDSGVRSKVKLSHSSFVEHWADIRFVFRDSRVWLQGGIIVCAYCGFKSLDNYGIFATQVMGMDLVESAELTTMASYTRPIAAIGAGLIADKLFASKSIILFFSIAALSFIAMTFLNTNVSHLIVANIIVTFVSVYALRGVYFALVDQSKLSLGVTGTAVGLISLIGYTPDIFFASVTGRILDANPGLTGFQHYFIVLCGICLVGIILAHALNLKINERRFSKD